MERSRRVSLFVINGDIYNGTTTLKQAVNLYIELCEGRNRGNHGMDDIYLKLFLKEIGIPKAFLNYSWDVEREWVVENGRIDFFLKCKKNVYSY